MISDESEIFPRISEINKEVKLKLQESGLINKINEAAGKNLKDEVQT
jgi:hypothetical protein